MPGLSTDREAPQDSAVCKAPLPVTVNTQQNSSRLVVRFIVTRQRSGAKISLWPGQIVGIGGCRRVQRVQIGKKVGGSNLDSHA